MSPPRIIPNIAPVAGTVLYRRDRRRTAALAMLQAYVPNQGDAWNHVLTELSANGDAAERYAPFARLLGQRTAEMPLARASRPEDPAFAPEPTLMLDARSVYQSVRSLATQVLPLLRHRLDQMSGEARADADALLRDWDQINVTSAELEARKLPGKAVFRIT